MYLRWAIALAGALILIAVSTITLSERVYPASTSPDNAELTLGGVSTFEQSFRTTRANLVGLTLRIRLSEPADAGLTIPIRLRYEDGPPIDIVRMALPLSAARDGELTFSFPAPIAARDPHAISDTLRMIIDAPALPPNSGPAIAAEPSPQRQGRLLINGAPSTGYDLIIIPSYQRRWIDSFWPISQMAANKPGPLGWPPLYVLLPYLYAILLLKAGSALRRALRASVDA